MTDKRFFFAIHYIPAKADCGLLAGRCISTLHGYLLNHADAQIGVAFPCWSNKSIGRTIAFVSEHSSHLTQFHERAYFQTMQDDGLFELSPALEVPDDCAEVRFIRNQNLAKLFVGERRRRLARSKRRAAERGELFVPKTPAINKEIAPFHCALLQSASNAQSYVLHIQKQLCDSRDTTKTYSHYGLASPNSYRGSVPELSTSISTIFPDSLYLTR
jgi:CRISPR-associated endonuclease Csy4